jgi:hypothetical protein
LSPVILRERIEDEIRTRIDMELWDHAVQIEAAERESMRKVLTRWQASISGQARK